jgi:OsmC-like protein
MATTDHHSYAAQVRLPAGEPEGVSPSRIVIQHHRAPRVEWNVDVATGGHMLHLAIAQCVFNNVLRLGAEQRILLSDVNVAVDGDFNTEGTASTGIDCVIELNGDSDRANLIALAKNAFDESSVVAVLRRAGRVELQSVRAMPSNEPPGAA